MSQRRTCPRQACLAFALAASALLASGAVEAAHAQESRAEADVREVVRQFKEALRGGDSTTVVRLLHPEARIYEGGHAETRDEYRSGHLAGDIAFLAAVSSETLTDEVVTGASVSLYMSESRTTGEYRGRSIDGRGTETIVLVPTADGWRIRHIHWSSR